jgi:hypothetical protein
MAGFQLSEKRVCNRRDLFRVVSALYAPAELRHPLCPWQPAEGPIVEIESHGRSDGIKLNPGGTLAWSGVDGRRNGCMGPVSDGGTRESFGGRCSGS